MHFRIFLLFLLITVLEVSAQKGRLLLVGGGSEKNGASGWSTPAYKWAVQGKRVAVIGTSTGSLAPYLTQYCGASYAREIAIASRDSADSQITYDTLVSYDAIFFRGGDQWEYYNYYRNTKLQEAVECIYSHGGTICGTSAGMHILSSTVFTAEEGTVYSYECIENPNNIYITLESDFFNFMPGYLFDTHFAERSRFGRLAGFLANLKLNKGVSVTGIGMDDLTCMTVDTNGIGMVYGTGCANIYNLIGEVSLHGTKLLADSIRVIQLLQGCTYDFNTAASTFESLDRDISTDQLSESGNHTILASGGYKLNENLTMLTDFAQVTGNLNDPILIVSGDNNLADSFRSKLSELGSTVNGIINPIISNGSDTAVKGLINRSGKFLFLENDAASFTEFLSTKNGIILLQKIRTIGSITAFAGNDARFAGKTVVDNYLEYLNSYYAEMTFSKGLGLLQNTVILPNTYLNSDIYENTATAIPYAMSLDTLKYGIWLTNLNYMKYAPVEGKAVLTGFGIDPVMIIRNSGHRTGFSTHTATGSGSISPRQVAGMEQMVLSMIDETKPYIFGDIQVNSVAETDPVNFSFECNFLEENLNIFTESIGGYWEIITSNGMIFKTGKLARESTKVDMSKASSGMYFIRITTIHPTKYSTGKFIWK